MNYCPEHEVLILEYDELATAERVMLDAHLETCEGCRAFAKALATVDAALSVSVHEAFESTAHRPERPPFWPELLDMAGWASVLGAMFAIGYFQGIAPWLTVGVATSLGSLWFGLKSWRELSH